MSNTELVTITSSRDLGQAMVYVLADGREATIFKGGHDKTIDLLNKTIGKAIQLPLYFSKKPNPKTGMPYLNISPMFDDEKYKPSGGIKPQVLTVPVTQSQTPAPAPAGYTPVDNKHKDHCVFASYGKDVVIGLIRAGVVSVPDAQNIEKMTDLIQNYAMGFRKIVDDMDKPTPT